MTNKTDNRTEKFRNDSRSTDELIRLALAADPDADDDGYWNLIFVLQHRVTEILPLLLEMCEDSGERVRDIAVTVLGQSGAEERLMVDEAVGALIDRLGKETSTLVLESAVFALGHLEDPRKIAALVGLVDHPSQDIRYALAHSLSETDDPKAIGALIQLSTDSDDDVRNWATFSLGSETEADTPELRDALAARLEESNGEVRMEAVVGLVERGDARAIPILLSELENFASSEEDAEYQKDLVMNALDAAVHQVVTMADQAWLPVVEKAATLELGDPELLKEAMKRSQS